MLARKDASDDDNDQKPGSVDLSWIQSYKKGIRHGITCVSLQGILSVLECASIEVINFRLGCRCLILLRYFVILAVADEVFDSFHRHAFLDVLFADIHAMRRGPCCQHLVPELPY